MSDGLSNALDPAMCSRCGQPTMNGQPCPMSSAKDGAHISDLTESLRRFLAGMSTEPDDE